MIEIIHITLLSRKSCMQVEILNSPYQKVSLKCIISFSNCILTNIQCSYALNNSLDVIFDESIIKKISETKEKHNPKNDMQRGKILKYKKVLSKIFCLEYQKFYTFNKLKSLNVIFTYLYLFI